MIGRRATVGLSLLCALMFCAFAAQSASAAKSTKTTAVTCVEKGGNEDFEDAHCDKKVADFKGKFGHEAIPNKTTTEITVDNTTTGGATDPAVLKGKAFGASSEITCTTVHGEGTIHNEETSGKHTVTGTITVKYTGCSVQKPAKCEVAEPIEFKSDFEGVEEVGSEKNEMGVEFKPHEGGKVFVGITFKNKGAESCAFNGKTINVEGSAIARGTPASSEEHSGATSRFLHNTITTDKTLIFGGEAAGFESINTVRMKNGNPISLTTTKK